MQLSFLFLCFIPLLLMCNVMCNMVHDFSSMAAARFAPCITTDFDKGKIAKKYFVQALTVY